MMIIENEDVDHRIDLHNRNYDAFGEKGFIFREPVNLNREHEFIQDDSWEAVIADN